MSVRRLLLAAILGTMTGVAPGLSPLERGTLRGIRAVSVLVENLDLELAASGLTPALLRSEVESRLRRGGIPVSTKGSDPVLYVHVYGIKTPDGFWTLALEVSLRQHVRLGRDLRIATEAATWNRGRLAAMHDPSAVCEELLEVVDRFSADVLLANPGYFESRS